MGATTTSIAAKYQNIELVPWDPTEECQFQRMHDQRVTCGWHEDEVPEWKDKMLQGQKFLYWIVLSESLPEREKYLALHTARCPKESKPLRDTARVSFDAGRKPTGVVFHPIGHIALESIPDRNAAFSLPVSTLWIRSLYVSWSLQALGLGRSAMAQVEHLAALPPLNGTIIALDTIEGDLQLREESLHAFYDLRGLERPKVLRSNESWYLNQGYSQIARVGNGTTWTNPVNGEMSSISIVYMTKPLVK